MRTVTALVFDETIVGTGTTWYTSEEFQPLLMQGDGFAVQACTKKVSGDSPTLTVQAEHSEDQEHWIETAAPQITGAISSNGSLGGIEHGIFQTLMSFLRFRIQLGGTDPRCTLKLYVTMRTLARDRPGAGGMEMPGPLPKLNGNGNGKRNGNGRLDERSRQR
jgi:hypothetical protein